MNNKERAFIQARLAADSDCTHDERFTWGNVLKAFKDPKCWLYGLAFHTMSLPLYTLSLFMVSFPPPPSYTCLAVFPLLESRLTDNALTITTTAQHHPISRLHSRQCATPHHSTLRLRLCHDTHHRCPLGALQQARPLPRSLIRFRRHRVHHPLVQHEPDGSPGCFLRWHLFRSGWNLPGDCACAVLAGHQRQRADEAGGGERDADFDWQPGRGAGHAAVPVE